MKIRIIVIGLMVLVASTVIVTARSGGPEWVWTEDNKVMFLHFTEGDSFGWYEYEINLTGPGESDTVTTYTGNITRGEDVNKKLFTVIFAAPKDDGPSVEPTNPTGDIYTSYGDTNFEVGDSFGAQIIVYNSSSVLWDAEGPINIIEEEDEV